MCFVNDELMKRQINIQLGSVLLICLATLIACGQDREKDLDRFFKALAQNQQFSGNVLVAERGKIIYEKSFGFADFAAKTKNTKSISFPIASVSKLFTATAILQQIEQGQLRLNDPVVKFIPEFPYSTITIRHLLSHTSGLPPYNAFFDSVRKENPKKVFTNSDFLAGLIANPKPLIYQPGEKGNYDNVNYIVLALILEKVTGMTLSDYVEKNILKPAGMNDTVFFPLTKQLDPANNTKNFAFSHLYLHQYSETPIKSSTIPYVASYWHAYGFNGFGDYVSTTHDLLKFDEAYYSGKLLKASTTKEAFTPIKLNDGTVNPGLFGLGWEVEKDDSLGQITYHSGAAIALSCVLLRNITKHQTVVLFDNTHYNAHEDASNALKILNGINVPPPKKSLARVYGQILLSKGEKVAQMTIEKLKSDTVKYYLNEEEFNTLGYDFLGINNPYELPEEHRYQEALATFKLNTELFPTSSNAYDSYGEALLKVGRKDEAIKMYRKSVELNPKNENGKKILEQLNK